VPEKTIILEGYGPAGEFIWNWPRRDGSYFYAPYRSAAHLQLGRRVLDQGSARCYYARDGCRVSFSVVGFGLFARLRLADFPIEENPAPQGNLSGFK
jgi:hypothetical protein